MNSGKEKTTFAQLGSFEMANYMGALCMPDIYESHECQI